MASKIKISIPTPCHENWGNMAPADRGRFCAACHKTVIDFTNASDREIVSAYNQDSKLCGRFLPYQLDRELVFPEGKKSLWSVSIAAALVLFTFGGTQAIAQTPVTAYRNIHTTPKKSHKTIHNPLRTITGTVADASDKLPLPGVAVTISGTGHTTTTDIDGKFSIQAATGDTLLFEYEGYENYGQPITDLNSYYIDLTYTGEEALVINSYYSYSTFRTGNIGVTTLQENKRTFFGRVFHAIGNIFR